MPVKENGKQFKSLRKKQVSELRAILGEAEAVENYLWHMDDIVDLFIRRRKNPIHATRNPAGTRDKVTAIKHTAKKLIAELQDVGIETGKSYGEETPIDIDLWSLFYTAQSIKSLQTGVVADPDFLHKLVGSLQYLEEMTTSALTLIAKPKRGDVTRTEREQQMFEKNMIYAYMTEFRCFPSQTQGGAFHRAAEIFYRAVRLPSGNSYQRICNAIKRQQQASCPDGVPAGFKPKRRLHPNGI